MSATTPGAASLAGSVSMVTGATGGLGRVIATELARLGSTVVIVCRDAAGGERSAADRGGNRHGPGRGVTGDLSSRRACSTSPGSSPPVMAGSTYW